MKAKKLWFVMGVLVLLGASGALHAAAPPSLLNYQGVLRDATGAPENGGFDMDFAFYDTDGGAPACPAVGGTLLLTDSQLGVPVTGGLFNVQLGGGAVTPGSEGNLTEVFRDNGAVYVEVEVAGEILCPRVQVISAAYSLNADHLDGKDSSQLLDTSATAQMKAGSLSVGGLSVRESTGRCQLATAVNCLVGGSECTGSCAFVPTAVCMSDGSGTPGSMDDCFLGALGACLPDTCVGTEVARLDSFGDLQLDGDLAAGGMVSGDGSGLTNLDAELLDGKDSTEFLDTSATPQTKAGDLSVAGNLTLTAGTLEFADGSVQTSAVNTLPPDTCFDNVGRFVVCGNGTVKDNLTGLFWLEDAGCSFSDWAAASITAGQLADGQCGLTDGSSPGDWRLPTYVEWQVIVDQAVANGCSAPYVPDTGGLGCWSEGDPFSDVNLTLYWSSTTRDISPSLAWTANLFQGNFGNNLKTVNFSVWPVRAGP